MILTGNATKETLWRGIWRWVAEAVDIMRAVLSSQP
jgi:hypothetical protein